MVRPVPVAAAAVITLTLVLLAALIAFSPGTRAADTNAIFPAGPSADFKANTATISYTDTSGGAGQPGQPITQAAVGEDFRVKVSLVFHNNGPAELQPKFKFTLLGPPPSCEFLEPADGIYEFESDPVVPVSSSFVAFVEIKVRCNEPGSVVWTASASVLPRTGSDPDLGNNVASDSSSENPITITGGSPTPTPTVTPTATPGDGDGDGDNGGPPGVPPTDTPTPTYTYPPPTNFPNEFQDPFFSVRPNGPSGLNPADILRAPTSEAIFACTELGLVCGGVGGQGPPVQDDIDAFTFANERLGAQSMFFSTDSDSVGIEGSGTHSQSNDALQCTEEGNEYAEFPIGVGGNNVIFFPATALGLQATTCPDQANDDDDMDGLSWGSNVQFNEDEIYYSLASGSPTLTALAAGPADILTSVIGGAGPSVYRSAASLGLRAGDDIDGLCLYKVDNTDRFLLSLARNSPTLALIGASPADLLFPGGFSFLPNVFKRGSQYGLLPTDNLDAVKCQEPTPPRLPTGDFDCDGDVDGRDALLALLHVAGSTPDIPDCPPLGSGPANALIGDVNCDGVVTQEDVKLVLLAAGGVRPNLPVGCPPIGAV